MIVLIILYTRSFSYIPVSSYLVFFQGTSKKSFTWKRTWQDEKQTKVRPVVNNCKRYSYVIAIYIYILFNGLLLNCNICFTCLLLWWYAFHKKNIFQMCLIIHGEIINTYEFPWVCDKSYINFFSGVQLAQDFIVVATLSEIAHAPRKSSNL